MFWPIFWLLCMLGLVAAFTVTALKGRPPRKPGAKSPTKKKGKSKKGKAGAQSAEAGLLAGAADDWPAQDPLPEGELGDDFGGEPLASDDPLAGAGLDEQDWLSDASDRPAGGKG
jgi:hypothetical protein